MDFRGVGLRGGELGFVLVDLREVDGAEAGVDEELAGEAAELLLAGEGGDGSTGGGEANVGDGYYAGCWDVLEHERKKVLCT